MFLNLEIPMQKTYVQRICKKYEIDTQGITFKIHRSEKFLSTFSMEVLTVTISEEMTYFLMISQAKRN